jgi:hypothetical protein
MEKIDKSLKKNYLPVVLYLEALEGIVDAFTVEGNKIEIRADDYSFDSITELSNHFKVNGPKSLEVKSLNPYGRLELNPLWAELYMGSSSIESAGIFYKIDRIMSSSERRPRIGYSYYSVWLLPLLSWIPNILPKSANEHDIFLIFNVPFLWVVWVLFIRLKKHSTLILERFSNKQGFLKRNSDAIKLLLIGAILGCISTIAGQIILEKMIPLKPTMSMDDKAPKPEKIEK